MISGLQRYLIIMAALNYSFVGFINGQMLPYSIFIFASWSLDALPIIIIYERFLQYLSSRRDKNRK